MNVVELAKSFKSFLDVIRALPQSEGFAYTVQYLANGTPLFLRLATVCAAIMSLIFGTVTYLNLSQANTSFVSSLTSPWDKSNLPHTGLEAFLVATLLSQEDWQGLEKLQEAKVSPSFQNSVTKLEASLSEELQNRRLDLEDIKIHTKHTDPGAEIFLSDRSQGFLFVPGIQLSDPAEIKNKVPPIYLNTTSDNSKRKPVFISDDPGIFKDVALSESAAPILCDNGTQQDATFRDFDSASSVSVFETKQSVLSESFSQAYLIFQSGVARLCEYSAEPEYKSQRAFYGVRFKPYTLLQERPYFQGALSKPTAPGDATGRDYFFESGPYMDIAGNGLVDTFCRYISVKPKPSGKIERGASYQTDAVLCFDFTIKKDLATSLIPRIARYGGTVASIKCENSQCSRSNEQPQGADWFSRSRWMAMLFGGRSISDEDIGVVDSKFQETQKAGNTSELLGRVSTFPLDGNGILFTIPEPGEKLLVGRLDLPAYQARSFIVLLLAGVAITATIVLLFLGVADYGLKIKEQQRAFEAVDQVMTDVKLAYMRVDEDGKINHLNDEAARELGYTDANIARPQLKKVRFEDLLADTESDNEYLRIKAERLRGEPYRKYAVRIWTNKTRTDGPSKMFEVHGWNVPTPQVGDKKPGQSFGILIPVDSPESAPE